MWMFKTMLSVMWTKFNIRFRCECEIRTTVNYCIASKLFILFGDREAGVPVQSRTIPAHPHSSQPLGGLSLDLRACSAPPTLYLLYAAPCFFSN